MFLTDESNNWSSIHICFYATYNCGREVTNVAIEFFVFIVSFLGGVSHLERTACDIGTNTTLLGTKCCDRVVRHMNKLPTFLPKIFALTLKRLVNFSTEYIL